MRQKYTPPFDNYLIINQVSQAGTKNSTDTRVFTYVETGVARSRNRALQKATAEICLLADDDVVFLESAESSVLEVFKQYPVADIITFQTQTPHGALSKKYATKQKWHTNYSLLGVKSCEIAFRTQSIKNAGLQFDERFGLGALFPSGEENIFLLDALRKGLRILYVPLPIVVHPEYSSGGNFCDSQLISAKGAMLFRMFGVNAHLLAAWFAFRKYRLSNRGYRQFYRLMQHGISAYKKDHG